MNPVLYSAQSEKCTEPRALRFSLKKNAQPASYAEVLAALQRDAAFRTLLNATLAHAPFSAFRFETPGVTQATLNRAFEFVLLDCPTLARAPEPEAFAEHFSKAQDGVAAFANLGRDAMMIVPAPVAAPDAYGHLAAFVRKAPEKQQQTLWQRVGEKLAERISIKPVWLSTAGAGVAWLHVRLDDRPKYYGYEPYRTG